MKAQQPSELMMRTYEERLAQLYVAQAIDLDLTLWVDGTACRVQW